jgi:mono/diheme cytochrome c family protein
MAVVPRRDDGYLAQVISQGRGGMPAWGRILDASAIRDVIAHLRREADAARAR